MSDLEKELEAEALKYQADAHAAEAKEAARVADFVEATEPAPAEQTPEEVKAKEAKQMAEIAAAVMPKLTLTVWAIADRYIQGVAGPHVGATRAELEQLASATVPVLEKYLPKGLEGLFTTPEGALIFTAAIIYAPKFMEGPPSPAPAAVPEGASA